MLFSKIKKKHVVEEAMKTVVPTLYGPVAWILIALILPSSWKSRTVWTCEVMIPQKD